MNMYQSVLQKVVQNEHWGVHLCRISIAIVFLWIGWLKFIPYEADSIVPFVANSPFMSWLYNDPANYLQYMNGEGVLNMAHRAWHESNNTYGYSNGLGVVEILFALLLLSHYISPKIGFIGATLCFLTPFVTYTFLIFTPETWVHGADAHTGFPYLSGAGRLVLKDAMMTAAGFVAMVDSAKAILRQQKASRPITA
ncbi:MAG: reactive chlorine resistance membrane protein RclC [Pelistega sp.]|nr:reactive chlorine resistance membrane protein RclC [Pelistega sp.]